MKIELRNLKIPFKRLLFVLFGFLSLLAIIILATTYFAQQVTIEPEPLLTSALNKTLSLNSFRYRSEAKIITEQKQSYYAKINGEKVEPDKTHIKGTMVQTPIDIYLIGNTTYLKNDITNKWQVLEGNFKTDILVSEINPLVHLNFKEIKEVKFVGMEEKEGQKLAILEVKPVIANPVLEMSNNDFFYQLWINPEDQYIIKIKLNSKSKSNPNTKLVISIDLFDFNSQEIKINAPPMKEG